MGMEIACLKWQKIITEYQLVNLGTHHWEAA